MPENSEIVWEVILNPHAGGGKGARDQKNIEQLLKNSDILYRLTISQFPGHAIEIARELVSNGATNIIVAGGDGTLNEVVNGIFLAEQQSRHEVTLGCYPSGPVMTGSKRLVFRIITRKQLM